MKKIILVGGGGHARSCVDVIEKNNIYDIVGIVDKDMNINTDCLGYPTIGTDNDLERLRNKYDYAFLTIGQIGFSEKRLKLFNLLINYDFNLPVIVSPLAYVSKSSSVGQGTIIMHHALVNANAKIGKNCIINSKTLIEHDIFVGNHCHISTSATLNGGVHIGEQTFVGSGAVVRESIKIGSKCIISAGEVIMKDIPNNSKVKN